MTGEVLCSVRAGGRVRSLRNPSPWRAALRIACLTCLLVGTLALADEARQAYSPERTGSGWDVGLDLSGAVLVASAMLLIDTVRRRPLFSREREER